MFRFAKAVTCSTILLLSTQLPVWAGPWTIKTLEPAPDKPLQVKIKGQPRFLYGTPTLSANYEHKYKTVAHQILEIEKPVRVVTPDMYKLLDSLIETASEKIQSAHGASSFATAEDCKIIDDVLIANNFVYPGRGLIHYFSEALTPTKLTGSDLDAVIYQPHNYRRRAHIQQHSTEPFYIADCDTTSFIYLAVFQNLKMERALIEIPGHNFIRCFDEENKYFNWETMDGKPETDNHYIVGWNIPQASIDKGIYLARMTDDNVLGYGHCLAGQAFEVKKLYQKAIDEYLLATQMYGHMPGSWNNAAWVYVTARDEAIRNGKKAVELATKAVELVRDANFLDTLACAYAENRQFDKAVETEQEAYSISGNPSYRENIEHFRNGKTWVESHPETMIAELQGNN